ncbi:MAG: hypothetical protein NT027_04540 [Proteobacteria bacterium]|nr:hypothetical protein [Pseudomonadota bacterium]
MQSQFWDISNSHLRVVRLYIAMTIFLAAMFSQSCKSREPVSSSKGLRDTNFDVSYDEITKKYKVSCKQDKIHTYANGDQTCTPTFATEAELLKACETEAGGKCGAGSMWTLDMCTEFRFARLESLTFEVMSDWGDILKGKSKSEAIFDYCKTFAYGFNKILVDNPALLTYFKSKFIRVQSKELKAKVEDKIVTIHWDIKNENLEAVFVEAKASPVASGTGVDVQFASDVIVKLSNSLLTGRSGHAAAAVGGKLMIWGGFDGNNYKSDGAIFDVESGQWSKVPKAPISARSWHSAAVAGSKIVFWGGKDLGLHADGAVFDISTGLWTLMPKSPIEGRADHSASYIGDSKILIFGGIGEDNDFSDGAIFDVSKNSWTSKVTNYPYKPIHGHSSSLSNGKIMIWGGRDSEYKSDGAIYEISTGKWAITSKAPISGRADHIGVSVGDKVFFWGGYDASYTSDGVVYNLSSGQWTTLPLAAISARRQHSAAVVGNRILIWGGYDGSYKSDGAIFDAATMTWMK